MRERAPLASPGGKEPLNALYGHHFSTAPAHTINKLYHVVSGKSQMKGIHLLSEPRPRKVHGFWQIDSNSSPEPTDPQPGKPSKARLTQASRVDLGSASSPSPITTAPWMPAPPVKDTFKITVLPCFKNLPAPYKVLHDSARTFPRQSLLTASRYPISASFFR